MHLISRQTCVRGALVSLALASLEPAMPSPADTRWETDFESAKKQADEAGKDLFFNFTGSDWCGFCISLKEQIFDTEAFLKGVAGHFVLVEVDFPEKKEQSEDLRNQNEKLRVAFGVEGFPTLFLADAKGRPYGHIPNQPGLTPEQFVAQMESHRGMKEKRDERFAEAGSKEGLDRAKALHSGLEALDEEIVNLFYGETIDEIIRLDPEDTLKNAAGRKFAKALGELREKIAELARDQDHEAIGKAIDSFIADGKLESEQKQAALMLKLGLFGASQLDEVVAFLAEVIKLKPDSKQAAEAEEIRARVEQFRGERTARLEAGAGHSELEAKPNEP